MVNEADQKFLMEAAVGGMMEVKAAQLAQEKAQSEEVKNFAKQLEQDHSKANEQLKQLAAKKNVQLPTEISGKHQEHLSKLQNTAEGNFDRTFVKMQTQHHQKDIKAFEKQTDRSMDSDVKEFASSTLPTLRQHLQTVQGLQTSTRSRKADSSTSTGQSGNTTTPSGNTGRSGPEGRSGDTTGTRDNTGAGRTDSTSGATDKTTDPVKGQNNPTPKP
jgi:putative membrane protein